MKTADFNQMSFFDLESNNSESVAKENDGLISITRVRFISQELTTYEKLFKGYNELRVITYSYALSFIEHIMHFFEHGEVIIGFENLIDKTTAELFALQELSTNTVCNNPYLQKRINDDEFRFFVLNDLVSHQKIYLLKADDCRVRTISGSANFSHRAWNGNQLESIIVCDDLECYEAYEKQYDALLTLSTDEISKDAIPIAEDGENIDELPIFKKVKHENAIVIHESTSVKEQEYVFHVQKLNNKWGERVKISKIMPSPDGKTLLEFKNVKTLSSSFRTDNALKKERELNNPQFVLDFENHTATYNQNSFNLLPSPEAVSNDLTNLIEYMEGFDLFTKDTTRLKTLYWKVLNYMFLSPFIAKLRFEGNRCDYEDRFFPMYMLVYGDSDAGKTGFINLTKQLMFNETQNALTQSFFSSKPMTALKTDVKGCPILIDELTPTYWKYAKDIVKMDVKLIENKMLNHPTFVLLSNDINNVAPELSKRIIVINLDNRLDRKAAAYNGKKINSIRKKLDNALYCEYLRRMFDAVDKLIEEIRAHDTGSNDNWIPDIFKVSSKILQEIMKDNNIAIPKEFHEFTWFDYMGDIVIGEKATSIIKDEFAHNMGCFNPLPSKNELEIDFACYGDVEAKKKLKILHDELPAELECKIVGTKVVLKLDAAKKHTGISFKRKPFWRR